MDGAARRRVRHQRRGLQRSRARSGISTSRRCRRRSRSPRARSFVLAWAAAFLAYRETRVVDEYAPGPSGRIRFFAQAALLANVLFLVIVVSTG